MKKLDGLDFWIEMFEVENMYNLDVEIYYKFVIL